MILATCKYFPSINSICHLLTPQTVSNKLLTQPILLFRLPNYLCIFQIINLEARRRLTFYVTGRRLQAQPATVPHKGPRGLP